MSNFLCSCCNHQRAELVPQESWLNQQRLLLCSTCLEAKHQPRWIIILTARSSGLSDKLTKVIRDQRYCGKEITGKELF